MISKDWLAFILISLIFMVVGVFFLTQQPPKQVNFENFFEENNFVFASNFDKPKSLISSFSKKKTFYIIAPFTLTPSPINSVMNNSFATPIAAVAAGNDINAVLFFGTYSDNQELIKCGTNFGNPKTFVELEKEQCLKFFNSKDFSIVKVQVFYPNSSQNFSLIEFGENNIFLKPKKITDLTPMTLAIVRKLFSNADEVLDITNKIGSGVLGGSSA